MFSQRFPQNFFLNVRERRCVKKDQYLYVRFVTEIKSSVVQNDSTSLSFGIYFNRICICLDVAWILQKYSHRFIEALLPERTLSLG